MLTVQILLSLIFCQSFSVYPIATGKIYFLSVIPTKIRSNIKEPYYAVQQSDSYLQMDSFPESEQVERLNLRGCTSESGWFRKCKIDVQCRVYIIIANSRNEQIKTRVGQWISAPKRGLNFEFDEVVSTQTHFNITQNQSIMVGMECKGNKYIGKSQPITLDTSNTETFKNPYEHKEYCSVLHRPNQGIGTVTFCYQLAFIANCPVECNKVKSGTGSEISEASNGNGDRSNNGNGNGAQQQQHQEQQQQQPQDDNDEHMETASEDDNAEGEDTDSDHDSDEDMFEEDDSAIPDGAECFLKNPQTVKSSTPCSTELMKVSRLVRSIPEKSYGAANLADLLLSRGDARYNWEEMDLENVFVCRKHFDELVGLVDQKTWEFRFTQKKGSSSSGRVPKCMMPSFQGYPTHQRAVVAGNLFVTKEQSETLLEMKQSFVPLGRVMCKRHYDFLENLKAEHRIQKKGFGLRPATRTTFAESPPLSHGLLAALRQRECQLSQEYRLEDESVSDDDSQRPSLSQEEQTKLESLRHHIRSLAQEAQVSDVSFSNNFLSLASVTQERRARKGKELCNVIWKCLASDAPQFIQQIADRKSRSIAWDSEVSSRLDQIGQTIGSTYIETSDKATQEQILSIGVSVFSGTEIRKYIPDISSYKITEAKKRALEVGIGTRPERPAITRIRFNKAAVHSFLQFIKDPSISTVMPFGVKRVKMPDGSVTEIPNLVRKISDFRLVQLYRRMIQEKYSSQVASKLDMSISSFMRILEYLPATIRKAQLGLDYYTYEGQEGFDSAKGVADSLQRNANADPQWVSAIIKRLKEGDQYMRGDYKLHIKSCSRIAQHCLFFALSSQNDLFFKQECEEQDHSLHCNRCEDINAAFFELRNQIQQATFSPTVQYLKTELQHTLDEAQEAIVAWMKHIIRSVNQERAWKDLKETLPENAVLIVQDWAMKFLSLSGRESQTMWFGKRGIPWHISSVFWKNATTNLIYSRTYVHVIKQHPQDSKAVTAIMRNVLIRIKQEKPYIDMAYYRSDNAGCYKSASTLATMRFISEKSHIRIKRYDFSEPQAGKAACDRAAAHIKTHVRAYVDENHKCRNSHEFLVAVKSHGGLRGVTIVQGEIIDGNPVPSPPKLDGVTLLNNFEFDQGNSVKVWKAYGIGPGKIITPSWTGKHNPSHFRKLSAANEGNIEITDVRQSDIYWKPLCDRTRHPTLESVPECSDQPTANIEEEMDIQSQETTNQQYLYHCPVEGCTQKFLKYGNLMNHLDIGKHSFQPERLTMKDVALHMYSQDREQLNTVIHSLETGQEIESSLVATPPGDPTAAPLQMGFALKQVAPCKPFTKPQKDYLLRKFNEGESNQQKFDPRDVAVQMRRETKVDGSTLFSRSEYLKPSQIASFWSRQAQKRRKSGQPVDNEDVTTEMEDGEEPEPHENECVDDDEYIEDPNMYDYDEEDLQALKTSDAFEVE